MGPGPGPITVNEPATRRQPAPRRGHRIGVNEPRRALDCSDRNSRPRTGTIVPRAGQRTGTRSRASLRRSVGLGSTNGPGQEATSGLLGRSSQLASVLHCPPAPHLGTSAQVNQDQLRPVEATSSTVIKVSSDLDRASAPEQEATSVLCSGQQDQDAHHSTALGGQERSAGPGWARVAGWALRASPLLPGWQVMGMCTCPLPGPIKTTSSLGASAPKR